MEGIKMEKPDFLMDDLGGKTHYFRKHPNTSWGERCLIGMFLGSKYLQKPGVWKPRVSEFLETLGNFWQKRTPEQKKQNTYLILSNLISKNTPWVNNKQSIGNNIQGGLYFMGI